jgi:hypothetical protein
MYTAGQSNQVLFEGLEEKKFFLISLFLRNNKTIKCLKYCVRFELTTEDPRYKAFPDRGTNTYERDEKKKENFFFLDFFTKPSPKLSFTLTIISETGVANVNPLKSLNLNVSLNKKIVKQIKPNCSQNFSFIFSGRINSLHKRRSLLRVLLRVNFRNWRRIFWRFGIHDTYSGVIGPSLTQAIRLILFSSNFNCKK